MRTRTSPESSSWRPALRCLLAVYLACFVGGDRLLGLAHLALSDHRHTFCDEHGWYEDLPKTSATPAPPPASTDQDPSTIGVLAVTLSPHSTCLFLNGRTFRAPLQIADPEPEATLGRRAFDRARPGHDGLVGCRLLLSAPKTSPPFVAA
jgi:hypothetical protein